MTMISSNAGAGRRRGSRIADDFRRWVESAGERRRIRREMRELSHLPDHLLRDMGLGQYAAPHDNAVPLLWR
ncbi:DUF1127 domain-containing protein [Sulfitobacter sp. D35]|uniref:DUF1127 domain-containing protein n=1 Tax=Sulfitobacter sp. D35 TaxID=3083252 RepID=UPI0039907258